MDRTSNLATPRPPVSTGRSRRQAGSCQLVKVRSPSSLSDRSKGAVQHSSSSLLDLMTQLGAKRGAMDSLGGITAGVAAQPASAHTVGVRESPAINVTHDQPLRADEQQPVRELSALHLSPKGRPLQPAALPRFACGPSSPAADLGGERKSDLSHNSISAPSSSHRSDVSRKGDPLSATSTASPSTCRSVMSNGGCSFVDRTELTFGSASTAPFDRGSSGSNNTNELAHFPIPPLASRSAAAETSSSMPQVVLSTEQQGAESLASVGAQMDPFGQSTSVPPRAPRTRNPSPRSFQTAAGRSVATEDSFIGGVQMLGISTSLQGGGLGRLPSSMKGSGAVRTRSRRNLASHRHKDQRSAEQLQLKLAQSAAQRRRNAILKAVRVVVWIVVACKRLYRKTARFRRFRREVVERCRATFFLQCWWRRQRQRRRLQLRAAVVLIETFFKEKLKLSVERNKKLTFVLQRCGRAYLERREVMGRLIWEQRVFRMATLLRLRMQCIYARKILQQRRSLWEERCAFCLSVAATLHRLVRDERATWFASISAPAALSRPRVANPCPTSEPPDRGSARRLSPPRFVMFESGASHSLGAYMASGTTPSSSHGSPIVALTASHHHDTSECSTNLTPQASWARVCPGGGEATVQPVAPFLEAVHVVAEIDHVAASCGDAPAWVPSPSSWCADVAQAALDAGGFAEMIRLEFASFTLEATASDVEQLRMCLAAPPRRPPAAVEMDVSSTASKKSSTLGSEHDRDATSFNHSFASAASLSHPAASTPGTLTPLSPGVAAAATTVSAVAVAAAAGAVSDGSGCASPRASAPPSVIVGGLSAGAGAGVNIDISCASPDHGPDSATASTHLSPASPSLRRSRSRGSARSGSRSRSFRRSRSRAHDETKQLTPNVGAFSLASPGMAVAAAFGALIERTESIERKMLQQSILEGLKTIRDNVTWFLCAADAEANIHPIFISLIGRMRPVWVLERFLHLLVDEEKERLAVIEQYEATPLIYLNRPLLRVAGSGAGRTATARRPDGIPSRTKGKLGGRHQRQRHAQDSKGRAQQRAPTNELPNFRAFAAGSGAASLHSESDPTVDPGDVRRHAARDAAPPSPFGPHLPSPTSSYPPTAFRRSTTPSPQESVRSPQSPALQPGGSSIQEEEEAAAATTLTSPFGVFSFGHQSQSCNQSPRVGRNAHEGTDTEASDDSEDDNAAANQLMGRHARRRSTVVPPLRLDQDIAPLGDRVLQSAPTRHAPAISALGRGAPPPDHGHPAGLARRRPSRFSMSHVTTGFKAMKHRRGVDGSSHSLGSVDSGLTSGGGAVIQPKSSGPYRGSDFYDARHSIIVTQTNSFVLPRTTGVNERAAVLSAPLLSEAGLQQQNAQFSAPGESGYGPASAGPRRLSMAQAQALFPTPRQLQQLRAAETLHAAATTGGRQQLQGRGSLQESVTSAGERSASSDQTSLLTLMCAQQVASPRARGAVAGRLSDASSHGGPTAPGATPPDFSLVPPSLAASFFARRHSSISEATEDGAGSAGGWRSRSSSMQAAASQQLHQAHSGPMLPIIYEQQVESHRRRPQPVARLTVPQPEARSEVSVECTALV